MTYYWTAVSFLLGAVIGSFLNVVIYRLPRGESLVRPGSHCPGCGAAIKWHDNIPLFSWVWLRGRCRRCHDRISLRYPAVELLTGVTFALTFWRVGVSWSLVVAWAVVASAITIAFVYHDHSVVPDRILWPIAVGGFALSVALDPAHFWVNTGTGLAAAGLTAGVTWLARRREGRSGSLKVCDVGVAFLVGAVLGLGTLVALVVALLSGLVYVLGVYWRKRSFSSGTVRITLFLCVGAVVAVLTGEFAVNAYTSFYH